MNIKKILKEYGELNLQLKTLRNDMDIIRKN